MLSKLLWIVVLNMLGCAAHAPGDGRLVAVHLSSTVAAYVVRPDDGAGGKLPATPLSVFAAEGAHYWDAVGAQLRVGVEASRAAFVLEVVPDDGGVGAPSGDIEGWWSPVDGKVHVVLPLRFSGQPVAYRNFFAHEIGHALGLDHVDSRDGVGLNVMDPSDTCETLGELDLRAFSRL